MKRSATIAALALVVLGIGALLLDGRILEFLTTTVEVHEGPGERIVLRERLGKWGDARDRRHGTSELTIGTDTPILLRFDEGRLASAEQGGRLLDERAQRVANGLTTTMTMGFGEKSRTGCLEFFDTMMGLETIVEAGAEAAMEEKIESFERQGALAAFVIEEILSPDLTFSIDVDAGAIRVAPVSRTASPGAAEAPR